MKKVHLPGRCNANRDTSSLPTAGHCFLTRLAICHLRSRRSSYECCKMARLSVSEGSIPSESMCVWWRLRIRNSAKEVAAERFRQDLYYRLNVITIQLPPLRERLQDVPLLAAHFLQKYARENHKEITAIQQEAIEHLMRYDWPGNVRELENVIERAVVLTKGSTITLADLYLEERPGQSSAHYQRLFCAARQVHPGADRTRGYYSGSTPYGGEPRGHGSPFKYWTSDVVSEVQGIPDSVSTLTLLCGCNCQALLSAFLSLLLYTAALL